MSSLLILGGSGILGSEVIRSAEKLGLDYVAPRSSDLDIRDNVAVDEFISNFKPSWVINCAAWTNVDAAEEFPDKATRVNKVGPRNMAQVAKELKIPLIHISTDYVFSGQSQQLLKLSRVS